MHKSNRWLLLFTVVMFQHELWITRSGVYGGWFRSLWLSSFSCKNNWTWICSSSDSFVANLARSTRVQSSRFFPMTLTLFWVRCSTRVWWSYPLMPQVSHWFLILHDFFMIVMASLWRAWRDKDTAPQTTCSDQRKITEWQLGKWRDVRRRQELHTLNGTEHLHNVCAKSSQVQMEDSREGCGE